MMLVNPIIKPDMVVNRTDKELFEKVARSFLRIDTPDAFGVCQLTRTVVHLKRTTQAVFVSQAKKCVQSLVQAGACVWSMLVRWVERACFVYY